MKKTQEKLNKEEKNWPDMRVVQVNVDKDGKPIYNNVGAMWKNISKNKNEFYTLYIGELRLLVFPNKTP